MSIVHCASDLAVVALLAVTVCSLVGLVAIWASLAKCHWFLRIAVLLGFPALGMIISVYEVVLTFLIQSGVVVFLLPIVTARGGRKGEVAKGLVDRRSVNARRALQFSLADLLLFVSVACCLSAVVSQMPRAAWRAWPQFLGCGLGLGLVTTMAASVVFARGILWLRVILALLCLPAAPIIAFLLLVRASGLPVQGKRLHRAVACMARGALVVLSLATVVPPAIAYYLLMVPPGAPPGTLPDPNGYEELMRAGNALKSVVPDPEIGNVAQLRKFVFEHRGILDASHTALWRESAVPPRYFREGSADNFQTIRQLLCALMAEGKLAEVEGRTADMVQSYVDVVRLGQVAAYGGTMIDSYIGWTVQKNGVDALHGLNQRMTSDACRQLLITLQSVMAHTESPNVVIARERAWRWESNGWQRRLRCVLEDISGESRRIRAEFEQASREHRATIGLLTTEIGLHCYQLDNGEYPAKLADLVPKYLSEVPKDPFTDNPLVYRKTSSAYLLYSVGSDGNDDEGRAADSTGHGDIVVTGGSR